MAKYETDARKADIYKVIIPTSIGDVKVHIIYPKHCNFPEKHFKLNEKFLPAIIYFHGGGWVSGDFKLYKKLMQELANRTHAAVVFVDYTLAGISIPCAGLRAQSKWPLQIWEGYGVLKYIAEHGEKLGIDRSRIILAGESAGGNMATVVAMLSLLFSSLSLDPSDKNCNILGQAILYPVIDAYFNTPSYNEFKNSPILSRDKMIWFWDQYLPDAKNIIELPQECKIEIKTKSYKSDKNFSGDSEFDDDDDSTDDEEDEDEEDENVSKFEKAHYNKLISPLHAPIELLKQMPPTLVITSGEDILRDEGEAYAKKLFSLGVPVIATRMLDISHDFLIIDELKRTPQYRMAVDEVVNFVNCILY